MDDFKLQFVTTVIVEKLLYYIIHKYNILPKKKEKKYFTPNILKCINRLLNFFEYANWLFLLIFLSIVNKNNRRAIKFSISSYTLSYSLGTKCAYPKVQGSIIHLISVNNGQKFNRSKMHILKNLGVDLYIFKILKIKCT